MLENRTLHEVIKCFPNVNPFNFGETGQLPFSIISRDRMHVVKSESLLNLNSYTSVNVCFCKTKSVPIPIAAPSEGHTVPKLLRTGSCTRILLEVLCGLLVCLVVVQALRWTLGHRDIVYSRQSEIELRHQKQQK
jgi:hypothetical protein